jgi:hypothetical protein
MSSSRGPQGSSRGDEPRNISRYNMEMVSTNAEIAKVGNIWMQNIADMVERKIDAECWMEEIERNKRKIAQLDIEIGFLAQEEKDDLSEADLLFEKRHGYPRRIDHSLKMKALQSTKTMREKIIEDRTQKIDTHNHKMDVAFSLFTSLQHDIDGYEEANEGFVTIIRNMKLAEIEP